MRYDMICKWYIYPYFVLRTASKITFSASGRWQIQTILKYLFKCFFIDFGSIISYIIVQYCNPTLETFPAKEDFDWLWNNLLYHSTRLKQNFLPRGITQESLDWYVIVSLSRLYNRWYYTVMCVHELTWIVYCCSVSVLRILWLPILEDDPLKNR